VVGEKRPEAVPADFEVQEVGREVGR